MLGELALPVDNLEVLGTFPMLSVPQFLVCKLEMMTNVIVGIKGGNRRIDVNCKGLFLHYCRRAAINQLTL